MPRFVLAALLALTACDASPTSDPSVASLELVTGPEAATAAGATVTLTVRARDGRGAAVADVALVATLDAGGGTLGASALTTDADGLATLAWTVGVAPVANTVTVASGDVRATATTRATVAADAELAPTPFGAVDAWLTAAAREGSTEDLAFSASGDLFVGVPGGLVVLAPDGTAHDATPTGDGLISPLGITPAADGGLWVCDTDAAALVAISPEGVATRVVTADGADELWTPNDVAVGPDGLVYFTDSCLGRLLQFDPTTGAITARMTFDRATEGGPNGLAFDDAGHLWVTTENNALLCGFNDVGLTDAIAGLYRVDVAPGVLGPRTPVAEQFALFGDGLAFDAEGNLFVLFDTNDGFALDESIVYVLPKGGDTLVRFFGVRGQVLANVIFGTDAYGAGTLYFALLSLPPFTPAEARGVVRLPIGLRGRALP